MGIKLKIALLVFVAGLLLLHAMTLGLCGPHRGWGDDYVRRPPPAPAIDVEADVARYALEQRPADADSRDHWPPDVGHGRVLRYDEWDGAAVVQTYEEKWTEDPHLHLGVPGGLRWEAVEIVLPDGLHEATLVVGDEVTILASRWNPWWPVRSALRFWASVLVPEYRAANAVYRIRPAPGTIEYLFPGENLRPSPHRRYVAYSTAFNDWGDHCIRIYDVVQRTNWPVVSLTEADPGSGRSFRWFWSSDSRALLIRGSHYGFRELNLVYLVEEKRLINVGKLPADQSARARAGS